MQLILIADLGKRDMHDVNREMKREGNVGNEKFPNFFVSPLKLLASLLSHMKNNKISFDQLEKIIGFKSIFKFMVTTLQKFVFF